MGLSSFLGRGMRKYNYVPSVDYTGRVVIEKVRLDTHRCDNPGDYYANTRTRLDTGKEVNQRVPDGTLWECPECGTWWDYSFARTTEWHKVRWTQFITWHRIRKAWKESQALINKHTEEETQ
jgi:hypothetical protein